MSESKAAGDPFASIITKLELDKSLAYVTLTLPIEDDDDENDENDDGEDRPTERTQEVDIDIRIKAYNNAQRFYQEKKRMEVKEKKTMEASV